jgi:hypothetical protein
LNRKIQTEDKRKKHRDSDRGFYRNKTKGRNIETQADRILQTKLISLTRRTTSRFPDNFKLRGLKEKIQGFAAVFRTVKGICNLGLKNQIQELW